MTTDATRPRQRSSGEGWSLAKHDAGDATVYVLRGEFDLAVSAKLEGLLPAGTATDRIVLDMTEVTYCDSSCLQVLLRLGNRLRDAGGRFAIATTVTAVVRPIELLSLGAVMPLHPTVDAARASWGEDE
ncbi:STAS domain-containing protein [Amycolatopsis sp. cmx-8-4]|uniref:STAS domain-containing protein n=1 Tax=Amycolatopsis sp. cmx-8-4 TaxID=2790947 RepID=UPI003978D01A